MVDAETLFRLAFNVEKEAERELDCAPDDGRDIFLESMAAFLKDCLTMRACGKVEGLSLSSEENLRGFVNGTEKNLSIIYDDIFIRLERDYGWGINVLQVVIRRTNH